MLAKWRGRSGKALKWILLGCGGLLFVGSLGFGGCIYMVYSMTKEPADATQAFFNKVNAGELDTAYADTSAGFRAAVSREEFRVMFDGMRVTDVTLSERNIQNDTATVSGTITVEGGGTMALTVELVQNGDVWRVESITGPFGAYAASLIAPAD